MLSTGYINTPKEIYERQSILEPTDSALPERYLLKNLLPVQNQGNLPACVGYVINEMYQYRLQLDGLSDAARITPEYIYRSRSNREVDGMNPVDGFTILRESISDSFKLHWARLSTAAIKEAVMGLGPVMLCMACHSYSKEFWKGGGLLGGHAVSIVGWNGGRFILKNSWGTEWADGGYTEILLPEINSYGQEMWVLI
jgi:C1A family cysteine protease